MFYRFFIFILLLTATGLCAQPLQHYNGDPITVVDSNGISAAGLVNVRVMPADVRDITCSNLLSAAAAAIYTSLDVRSYGSLGAIALASFRGLPAEYVSLEFNGIQLTNSQNSLSDLALIDVNILSSIALESSASNAGCAGSSGDASVSAMAGAGSVAGAAIEVGSQLTSYTDRVRIAEHSEYVRVAEKMGSEVSLGVGVSGSSSTGSYPFFQPSTVSTVERENNQANLLNATIAIEFKPEDNFKLAATALYSKADRGAPGAVTVDFAGASSPKARQFDELYLFGLTAEQTVGAEFGYKIRSSYRTQFESYIDPDISANDRYTNGNFTLSFDGVSHSTRQLDLLTSLSFERNSLVGNEDVSATGSDLVLRSVYRANVGARFAAEHFTTAGYLKTEKYSDNDAPQVLPQLSLRYAFADLGLAIGSSYTRLYHAPTFNELYWRIGGNPALRPENGHAFEFVTDLSLQQHWSFKAAAFYNALSNQIIWQPGSTGVWSPVNVQASRTYGVECSTDARIVHAHSLSLQVRGAFTFERTENLTAGSINYGKVLPYTTPLRWNLSMVAGFDEIATATLSLNYRGERFPDYAANESTVVPAVLLTNLCIRSAAFALGKLPHLQLSAAITNVFDIQYDDIPNYPLPGREYKIGIDFTY